MRSARRWLLLLPLVMSVLACTCSSQDLVGSLPVAPTRLLDVTSVVLSTEVVTRIATALPQPVVVATATLVPEDVVAETDAALAPWRTARTSR